MSSKAVKRAKGLTGKPNWSKARWWSTSSGEDGLGFIERMQPSAGKVALDNNEGRFVVSYPKTTPRSISWTARGLPLATLMAVRLLWQRHTVAKGEECPIPDAYFALVDTELAK